jgi:hypothetical protein
MIAPLDRAQLRATLLHCTRLAFAKLLSSISGENLYAFGLYTNGEGTGVFTTANTEEGLERKAQDYAASDGMPLDLHRLSLRWSPCDWAYHRRNDAVQCFEPVQVLLDEGWNEDYSIFHFDPKDVYMACIEALRQLHDEGIFTIAAQTRQPLICLLMGDQSNEERLAWAKLLNDHAATYQFGVEMNKGLASDHELSALSKAPDD